MDKKENYNRFDNEEILEYFINIVSQRTIAQNDNNIRKEKSLSKKEERLIIEILKRMNSNQ